VEDLVCVNETDVAVTQRLELHLRVTQPLRQQFTIVRHFISGAFITRK